MLLHMIAHEPEHLVRRSTADLLSAIAKLAYPAGQWPDLMQSLFGYSQSPHSEHRVDIPPADLFINAER